MFPNLHTDSLKFQTWNLELGTRAEARSDLEAGPSAV